MRLSERIATNGLDSFRISFPGKNITNVNGMIASDDLSVIARVTNDGDGKYSVSVDTEQ